MNSIFRKTLIASALAAMFSTVAIAADDYSKTLDGSETNNQGDMQQDESSSTHPAMPNHEDEFNQTIDTEKPAAGNEGDAEMQKSTDTPAADNKAKKSSNDMDKSSKTGDKKEKESDRPLTEHQDEVIEEEEEEEIDNTQMEGESDGEMQGQMDRNNDVQMDEQPHGPTGAGTPVNRGGLYNMSADELNGMDVITSDGENVGDVEKIVISPDNQNIHAVVSVGGVLGVGAKTILIPLENFTQTNDELHVKATQAELEEMTDYGSEDFVELDGNAAVSTAIRAKN